MRYSAQIVYRTMLVCNTDPAHRAGEHWVVMYVDDEGKFGEYFDSLGRPPRLHSDAI